MRKANREITNHTEILDLIKNMNTIRLGIHDEKYPYVVPLSFGFEEQDGVLRFYFHGANAGYKLTLLEKNPYVCIEGDTFYRYQDTIASVTCLYESIIAFGKAERLTGTAARHGMDMILQHCGYGEHFVNEKVLDITAVYQVTVDSITGKRRDRHKL